VHRRGILDWMQERRAPMRAFADRLPMPAHAAQVATPLQPGPQDAPRPTLPLQYAVRAALIAPPRPVALGYAGVVPTVDPSVGNLARRQPQAIANTPGPGKEVEPAARAALRPETPRSPESGPATVAAELMSALPPAPRDSLESTSVQLPVQEVPATELTSGDQMSATRPPEATLEDSEALPDAVAPFSGFEALEPATSFGEDRAVSEDLADVAGELEHLTLPTADAGSEEAVDEQDAIAFPPPAAEAPLSAMEMTPLVESLPAPQTPAGPPAIVDGVEAVGSAPSDAVEGTPPSDDSRPFSMPPGEGARTPLQEAAPSAASPATVSDTPPADPVSRPSSSVTPEAAAAPSDRKVGFIARVLARLRGEPVPGEGAPSLEAPPGVGDAREPSTGLPPVQFVPPLVLPGVSPVASADPAAALPIVGPPIVAPPVVGPPVGEPGPAATPSLPVEALSEAPAPDGDIPAVVESSQSTAPVSTMPAETPIASIDADLLPGEDASAAEDGGGDAGDLTLAGVGASADAGSAPVFAAARDRDVEGDASSADVDAERASPSVEEVTGEASAAASFEVESEARADEDVVASEAEDGLGFEPPPSAASAAVALPDVTAGLPSPTPPVEEPSPSEAGFVGDRDASSATSEVVTSDVAPSPLPDLPIELPAAVAEAPPPTIEPDAPAAQAPPGASAPPPVSEGSRESELPDAPGVQYVRKARPLPPEVRRLLEERRRNEPPRARPSEPPSETVAEPTVGEPKGEKAAFDPQLWMQRLRDAALAEQTGTRPAPRPATPAAAEGTPPAATGGRPSAAAPTVAASSVAAPSAVVRPADVPSVPVSSASAPSSGRPTPHVDAPTATPTTSTGRPFATLGEPGTATSPVVPVAAASRSRVFVPPVRPEAEAPPHGVAPVAEPGDEDVDTTLAEAVARTPEVGVSAAARSMLEPLLGIDPDSVRLQEGGMAGEAAAARDADALAVGEHILAPPGATTGDSPEALGLLAHELTHVARQRSPTFVPPVLLEGDLVPEGTPFVPPLEGAEEAVALAAERAVRRAARATPSPAGGPAPSGPEGGREAFGGFPAPGEPLPLPSVWDSTSSTTSRGERPAESPPRSRSSQLAEDWGGPPSWAEPASEGGEPSPVHAAQRGRDAEDGDRGGGGGQDDDDATGSTSGGGAKGDSIDVLARKVYRVLRRRLLAERRRGT